jgi:hypothetical protein
LLRRRTLTQFSLTCTTDLILEKTAAGFVEGFGMINSGKQQVIQNMIQLIKTIIESKEKLHRSCPRFGLGAKWTQKKRIYL